ncbi:MAG: ABC transporter permease [Actinomycetota bacterium]|nr:ABC transporter permease [Actinomycetota bacterium]
MSPRARALSQVRSPRASSIAAFKALLIRDVRVLGKSVPLFIVRTIMQPLLFAFVFTYVFPKIGQGVGGAEGQEDFSSLLVPGVVAIACIFQGIQAVALPLVTEFSYTREIEDRVMAPLPVWSVAVAKITSGAVQGILAGVVVFPLATFVPATDVVLDVHWIELATLLVLSALVGSSLGLAIGTRAKPHQVPLIFSVIVLPVTFLGATYYPWASLDPIPWLKWAVLVNPLVYMSEGLRTALTPQFPHMPEPVIYGALIGFIALLSWQGIEGFKKRVLA